MPVVMASWLWSAIPATKPLQGQNISSKNGGEEGCFETYFLLVFWEDATGMVMLEERA